MSSTLLVHRRFQASEQLVERLREVPELVARIGHRQTAAQILAAETARAVGHRDDRRQTAVCQKPSAEPRQEQRDRHHVRERIAHGLELLVGRFQRGRSDDDVRRVVFGQRHTGRDEPVAIVGIILLGHRRQEWFAILERLERRQVDLHVVVPPTLGQQPSFGVIDHQHLAARRELRGGAAGGIGDVLPFCQIVAQRGGGDLHDGEQALVDARVQRASQQRVDETTDRHEQKGQYDDIECRQPGPDRLNPESHPPPSGNSRPRVASESASPIRHRRSSAADAGCRPRSGSTSDRSCRPRRVRR